MATNLSKINEYKRKLENYDINSFTNIRFFCYKMHLVEG